METALERLTRLVHGPGRRAVLLRPDANASTTATAAARRPTRAGRGDAGVKATARGVGVNADPCALSREGDARGRRRVR